MAKTKTVPLKRFSAKNQKNQKTSSAKIEESVFQNRSNSNQNPMKNFNQNPMKSFNQNSMTSFNQNSTKNFNQNSMTNLENFPQNHNTNLVVVSIEQLAEIMQSIVKTELANHKPAQQIASEEALMNASETIAFLRVSRPTYQKLRRDGEIKAVAISERRILYRKSDLLAYINSKVN